MLSVESEGVERVSKLISSESLRNSLSEGSGSGNCGRVLRGGGTGRSMTFSGGGKSSIS